MEGINGIINNITLVVYGTTEQPAHYATSSRRDVRDDFVTNNRKDIGVRINFQTFPVDQKTRNVASFLASEQVRTMQQARVFDLYKE